MFADDTDRVSAVTSDPEAPVRGGMDRPEPACVAIIEDNREVVDLYAMLVRSRGMRVGFVARDGAEAVRAFAAAQRLPDVLIIDHRMPAKSGLEAMREMLALRPEARFVFISADADTRAEALAAGAKAFVQKPASINEIAETILNVLKSNK